MEPEPYIEQAWGSFGKNYYSNSHSSFNFDINDKYNLLQYINTNSYPKVDLKWDFHIEDNDDDISNGYPNYLSNRRQTNEILNTNITSLKLNTPPNYPIRPVVSNDNIVYFGTVDGFLLGIEYNKNNNTFSYYDVDTIQLWKDTMENEPDSNLEYLTEAIYGSPLIVSDDTIVVSLGYRLIAYQIKNLKQDENDTVLVKNLYRKWTFIVPHDNSGTDVSNNFTFDLYDHANDGYVDSIIRPDINYNEDNELNGGFYIEPVLEYDGTINDANFTYTYTSPILGPDNTIYATYMNGYIYALDLSGNLKWSYDAESTITTNPSIGPEGNIYFAILDRVYDSQYDSFDNGSSLVALNNDGSLLWKRFFFGPIYTSPSIDSSGNIYFGTTDGTYDISGNTNDKFPMYNSSFISLSPLQGDERWRIITSDFNNSINSINGSIYSSPAIYNDKIFFGSDNGSFYALNLSDGTEVWKISLGCKIRSSPAIDNSGVIFFLASDGFFYALNNNGTLYWDYYIPNNGFLNSYRAPESEPTSLDEEMISSPSIGPDGTVYLQVKWNDGVNDISNNRLLAFGELDNINVSSYMNTTNESKDSNNNDVYHDFKADALLGKKYTVASLNFPENSSELIYQFNQDPSTLFNINDTILLGNEQNNEINSEFYNYTISGFKNISSLPAEAEPTSTPFYELILSSDTQNIDFGSKYVYNENNLSNPYDISRIKNNPQQSTFFGANNVTVNINYDAEPEPEPDIISSIDLSFDFIDDDVIDNYIDSLTPHLNQVQSLQVNIKEAVTDIQDNAFIDSKISDKIEEIVVDNSSDILKTTAGFSQLSNLKYVQFPSTITEINENAFLDCTSLTNINITEFDSSINIINNNAFKGCTSIQKISLPEHLQYIGNSVFESSGVTEINYDITTVTNLGESIFKNSQIISFDLPSQVSYVPKETFMNSQLLLVNNFGSQYTPSTSNYLNNITSIHPNAFDNVKLNNIVFDDTLLDISDNAFANCNNLGSVLFTLQGSNNITSIGENAFNQCNNLSLIDIPQSVTSLGNNAIDNNGNDSDPIKLDIIMEVTDTTLSNNIINSFGPNIGNYSILVDPEPEPEPDAFILDGNTSNVIDTTYLDGLNYTGLTDANENPLGYYYYQVVTITSSVHRIDDNAFSNSFLKDIIVYIDFTNATNLTYIGNNAFQNCSNLEYFTSFPYGTNSKLEYIGDYAFDGCSNLGVTDFPWYKAKDYGNTSDGTILNNTIGHPNGAYIYPSYSFNPGFYNINTNKNIPFSFNNSLSHTSYFNTETFDLSFNIVIPDSVTFIGTAAFANCVSNFVASESHYIDNTISNDLYEVNKGGYAHRNIYFGINYNGDVTLDNSLFGITGKNFLYFSSQNNLVSIGDFAFLNNLLKIRTGTPENYQEKFLFKNNIKKIGKKVFNGQKHIETYYNLNNLGLTLQPYPSYRNVLPYDNRWYNTHSSDNTLIKRGNTSFDSSTQTYTYSEGWNGLFNTIISVDPSNNPANDLTLTDIDSNKFLKNTIERYNGASSFSDVFDFYSNDPITSRFSTINLYPGTFQSEDSFNFNSSIGNWNAYSSSIVENRNSIEFESNSQLTDIGEYTFSHFYIKNFGNSHNKGNGLTIGKYAFSQTIYNNKLVIPNNTSEIGEGAFALIYQDLNNFNVSSSKPNYIQFENSNTSLHYIPESCFANADMLWNMENSQDNTIQIPQSVTHIYDYAFFKCLYLEDVGFNSINGLTEIGQGSFFGCALTNITLPASVEKINSFAFFELNAAKDHRNSTGFGNNTSINNWVSKGSIYNRTNSTHLNSFIFDNVSPSMNNQTIILSTNLKFIGKYAFYGTNLFITELNIPSGVTEIHEEAFSHSQQGILKHVNFS